MYNTRASLADRKGAAFPGNHREEVRLVFDRLFWTYARKISCRISGIRQVEETRRDGQVTRGTISLQTHKLSIYAKGVSNFLMPEDLANL